MPETRDFNGIEYVRGPDFNPQDGLLWNCLTVHFDTM